MLPHASAVVTHAGHATVMASLAHGVPLVCLPMGRDQFETAARVAAIGAGLVIPCEADPAEVRVAVEDVLASEACLEAARRMAGIIERDVTGQTAVNEVERFVAG